MQRNRAVAGQPPPERRDHRRGQARRRDRRRRHRRGLRRLGPPRARGVGHPARHLPAARGHEVPRARAVAGLPEAAVVDVRARRGRRAPLLVQRDGVRRQRPRAGLTGDKVGDPPDFEPTGESHEMPADLVLVAIGSPASSAGSSTSSASRSASAARSRPTTSRPSTNGVFACGDARRGQSLIVWAIAEGRQCAAAVERYLTAAELSHHIRRADRRSPATGSRRRQRATGEPRSDRHGRASPRPLPPGGAIADHPWVSCTFRRARRPCPRRDGPARARRRRRRATGSMRSASCRITPSGPSARSTDVRRPGPSPARPRTTRSRTTAVAPSPSRIVVVRTTSAPSATTSGASSRTSWRRRRRSRRARARSAPDRAARRSRPRARSAARRTRPRSRPGRGRPPAARPASAAA